MGFLAEELHSNEREFQSKNILLLKLMNMQCRLQRKIFLISSIFEMLQGLHTDIWMEVRKIEAIIYYENLLLI